MAKRITAIVTLSILGLLIVATIIMANIPVSHNIQYGKPDVINIGYGGTSSGNWHPFHKEKDEYNTILSYIEKATSENALNALFNGGLGNSAQLVNESEKLKSIESDSEAYYLIFEYDDKAQTLKEGNKEYRDSNNNKYYYQILCFEVKKDSDTTKVYVIPSYDDNGREYTADGTLQYHKYYSLEANLSSLYSYLSNVYNNA